MQNLTVKPEFKSLQETQPYSTTCPMKHKKEKMHTTKSGNRISQSFREFHKMTASSSTSKLNAFILASRPKTLLASLVPVIVGSSAAYKYGEFKPLHAFVALICSVLIQISTNYIN